MNIQWSFRNCTQKVKSEIRSYWQQKQGRIERLASTIPYTSRRARLSVFHHPNRVDHYEIRAVMEIPGRSIAVQSSDALLTAALDNLADALASAIRKYKNLVRHTFRKQRKERNAADLASSLPMLVEDEIHNRKESFAAMLRPVVTFLEEQARRELKILELDGNARPGFITAEELVDEVVVKAWELFPKRPEDRTLEQWLTGLLYELLDNIDWNSSSFISLDEDLNVREIYHSAETDWMAEMYEADNTISIAELLPDGNATSVWEEMGSIEQQDHLYSGLQQLTALSRQTYLLNSVEEYSTQEIAQIQNRSPEDVECDIATSRDAMQEHLYETGMLE